MVGGEVGEEVVVDELAAVVDVDDLGREGEVGEDVVEGLAGGLGASVPGGGAGAPLGGGVGGVHDPEEAFAQVAAAEGDGVDLEHARLAGLVKPARPCGDLGGEGGFAAGAFVRRARRQAVRSDEACDGGDAHAAQFVGDGLRDRCFRLPVVPNGRVHDGVEIERAHLAHRQPKADEGFPGSRRIAWGAAAMGAVAIGAVEQTNDELARQAAHRHRLVNQGTLLRPCPSFSVPSLHFVHVVFPKSVAHVASFGAIAFDA